MYAQYILVFDIETIPDVQGIKLLYDCNPDLSDQEIVEQVFEERKEKTGSSFLPHHLQKIVAISCLLRHIFPQQAQAQNQAKNETFNKTSLHIGSLGSKKTNAAINNPEDLNNNEATLIKEFFNLLDKYTPQLVSWNGGGFDLPVLHYRGLINKITASKYWDMGAQNKDFKWNNYISRYHLRHIDMMDLLSMYQSRAYAPMDELAKLCGFPGKLGIDGSCVWQTYQDGNLTEIKQYCETDVVNTYLLYCRWQLMRGYFSDFEYLKEIEFVKATLSSMSGPQWPIYLKHLE